MKSFDLFAGCGGLTAGLHKAGLCDTLWANEFDADAAQAFSENFHEAEVFVEDINTLLGDILKVNSIVTWTELLIIGNVNCVGIQAEPQGSTVSLPG